MASNSFGDFFRFTSWGESHGKAIGCVIDGVPPLLDLKEEDIQKYLDKRKPGQSKFTTMRQEPDRVEILSGVFEGKTTGTPISLIIYNQDQRSKDYSEIANKFRPGHADITYHYKYGIRDYRGGGRSSARETAMRVAAGAVARKIIPQIEITAGLTQMGKLKIDPANWNDAEINNNPFFCPDPIKAGEFADYLQEIRKAGSSIGAIIEVRAKNVPIGLGDPIYDKLDTKIANALMSINAVKAVEIGSGFEAALLDGEGNADEISMNEDGKIEFSKNNAGGILGGISSGQEIVARFAVKPTSSILTERKTIDLEGNNTSIITKGRHDPCVGIRAVPVAEAMIACVLADSYLKQKAIR